MSNPIIRECDHYVVLEPGKEERFLTAKETLLWLTKWLRKMEQLPKDLQKQSSINESAQKLLDTACELEIKHGFKLQWFAIRLEPGD